MRYYSLVICFAAVDQQAADDQPTAGDIQDGIATYTSYSHIWPNQTVYYTFEMNLSKSVIKS